MKPVGIRCILNICVMLFISAISWSQSLNDLLKQSNTTYLDDPSTSYDLAVEAEQLAREQNDSLAVAESLTYQGRYILLKGDIDKANELLNEAISYVPQGYSYPQVLNLKSIILGRLGRDEEALRYSEENVEAQLSNHDTIGALFSLINLSSQYLDIDDPKKAKSTLDRVKQWEHLFTNDDLYFYHQNLGRYYSETSNFDKALKSLKKARDLAFDLGMQDSQCTILILLGETYQQMGRMDEALDMLQWSLELSNKYGLVFEKLDAISALSDHYERVGKPEKALEYYKKEVHLNDSLHGAAQVQRINDMEREVERAEQARKIARKDARIKQEQLDRKSTESRNRLLIYIAIALVLVIGIVLFTWFRTRKLNNIISMQNEKMEEKNIHLESALQDIHDSFRYGRRLQQAFLPSTDLIKETFDESLIIYHSKEIVSGDFYWMTEKDDLVFFAVGDCTGHGVPGAMLSVVGANGLNQCIEQESLVKVDEILTRLREIVKVSFSSNENGISDGMDISLCCWNQKKGLLEFAGANNPLWIVRKGEDQVEDIRGDRQPVGSFAKEKPFTLHKVEVQKGDKLYLFSDGYQDQFGGEFGKKLKTGNFKRLVRSTAGSSMQQQETELISFFKKWMGDIEQVDDVCILGVRL